MVFTCVCVFFLVCVDVTLIGFGVYVQSFGIMRVAGPVFLARVALWCPVIVSLAVLQRTTTEKGELISTRHGYIAMV